MVVEVQAGPGASRLVQEMERVIHERYADPLTIGLLSRLVNRRGEYVAAQFRRETGCTVHGYLTSVRMRQAGKLLKEGHKAYSVASQVGYKSRKNFYVEFRRYYGATPASYAATVNGTGASL
jgi:two-component system response regulator YesN